MSTWANRIRLKSFAFLENVSVQTVHSFSSCLFHSTSAFLSAFPTSCDLNATLEQSTETPSLLLVQSDPKIVCTYPSQGAQASNLFVYVAAGTSHLALPHGASFISKISFAIRKAINLHRRAKFNWTKGLHRKECDMVITTLEFFIGQPRSSRPNYKCGTKPSPNTSPRPCLGST